MTQSTNLYRHILRTTIEFTTPCLIGSGNKDDITDTIFVSDANGLPALPGSSLAGVLRAAFRNETSDVEAEKRIFGHQSDSDGDASRLRVSWACIHDSNNQPVEGIIPPERLNDPVLANAKAPILRDHVRISETGAAADKGKFDEKAIAAGHRFSFELELTSGGTDQDERDWYNLCQLLVLPALRIGGKSRRGYGAFKIIKLAAGHFDLRDPESFEAYHNHPASLAKPSSSLKWIAAPVTTQTSGTQFKVYLKPSAYWMIGGGDDMSDDGGNADMAPFRDHRIEWNDDVGSVMRDCLVIPATSIKGALAHRIAFHYNALSGCFADTPENPASAGEQNNAIRTLFGFVNEPSERSDGKAKRGNVIIDDLYLSKDAEPPNQFVHHVGIDRFTGGARDAVLFNERPLWCGNEICFSINVTDPNALSDKTIRQAFIRTLEDLTQSRLQLGAGHGRGLGFFTGRFEEVLSANSATSSSKTSHPVNV